MAHTVSRELTDETLNRIMAIESAGKVRAKAKTSSALGLFQFLNQTWMDTVKKHRRDLLKDRSKAQILALRVDPSVCIELGARFTEDNAELLGDNYTDGDLYLAHFLGPGAARKLLRASPKTPVSQVVGADAIHANPSILSGKTCGQVRAWAQNSMVKRWDGLKRHDWVAELYDSSNPLVDTNVQVEHEDHDDEPPVKHEDSFKQLEDLPDDDDKDDDLTAPEPKKSKPDEDREVPNGGGFFGSVTSIFRSKIAWLAGTLGFGGAGSSVSGDPDLQHLLYRMIAKPSFWLMVAAVVIGVAIIYFRWHDHSKSAQ